MIKHISLFIVLAAVSIQIMAQKKITQTAGRTQLGEFAPEFAHLNDDILFGEVWSRNDLLSLRDRSLVTITSLISQGITDSSLKFHLQSAKANGITRTEVAEIITHVAFYAGWPKAWAAFNLAKEVWADDVKGEDAKAAFQREMIFPIGEPNTAYAKYFKGNSYLAMQQLAHSPRHQRRWTDACGRGRSRLVSGRRKASAGNPARHCDSYSCQREALARSRKR